MSAMGPGHRPPYPSERIDTLEQWQRAITEGRRLERDAIVADLRARADELGGCDCVMLHEYADRYERGEHAKEEP